MTSIDKLDEPAGRLTAGDGRRALLAAELRETLTLAAPLAATQLSLIAMMTTDLALIGRLGAEAVAGAALGQTVSFMSFMVGMGVVAAVAPLSAQAFGARDPHLVRRSLRMGLWAALIISIPITGVQFFGEQILLWLGQTPQSSALAKDYLHGLAWGALPGLVSIALRNFMGAVNRPQPGLWIMLGAVPANGVLAYALIHGEFGLPKLGLFGAGLATSIVNLGMAVAAIAIVQWMRPFAKFHVFGHLLSFDWPRMRKLCVVGFPIAGIMVMEYGVFSAAALLMGLISTAAITAHQIALQIAAIIFMVPLGIGMAATVRVGHAIGRGEPEAVQRAGTVAIALGALFMAAMTLGVLIARDGIAGLFLGGGAQDTEASRLTATLLLVGATFFIGDGVQTVAAGTLRGLNDTRIPMLFAAIGYWAIGFTASCVLAFWLGFGAVGVWIGLSIGTAIYALALIVRFALLSRRLRIGVAPPRPD